MKEKTATVKRKREKPRFDLTVNGRRHRLYLSKVTIGHEEALEVCTDGRLTGVPSIERRMGTGRSSLLTLAAIIYLTRLQESDDPVSWIKIIEGLNYADEFVWVNQDEVEEDDDQGEAPGDASS